AFFPYPTLFRSAELDEILGEDLAQQLDGTLLLPGPDLGAEADAPLADPVGDDVLEPGEGAGADEEDVRGVELDELLVGVLAPTLGLYRRHRALEDLEEGLLDALARHVAGDGGVLRLAADLVDLVDVDDALLGPLDVVVGGLQELEEDVLDVFAHVPGFGEGRGVGDGEWDVELAGQGLGEEGLAAAGGADQQDVRLLELDVVPAGLTRPDPLVVVVDGDRQLLLGVFLAHHVVVEVTVDLGGLGQLGEGDLFLGGELLFDDLVAELDALVADVDARSGDELLDLLL